MVGILHKALILGFQGTHDRVVALLHEMLHVVVSRFLRGDGGMDGETQGVPCEERESLLAAQHVKRTVDGDGHHGHLQFVGQLKRATAEDAHVASERACSLGEYHQAGATMQYAAPLFTGVLDASGATLVHHDMAGAAACSPDERQLAQRLLHHPLEVAAQEAIDEENIVRALVVGHKDIGGVGLKVLAPFHADGEEHKPAHQAAPDHGGIIAPEVGLAQAASQDGDYGCERGGQQQDRCGHEELIGSV